MEPSRDELDEVAARLEIDGGLSPAVADGFARCCSMPIPRRERAGLEALVYCVRHGLALLPCRESGAAIAKWDTTPTPWTCDPQVVANLWNGKGDAAGRARGTPIQKFQFLPSEAGLLCLDIDRGHADGVDGLEQFYRLFGRSALPTSLRNIEIGSFPCFTTTPRGGFHVYFRYDGPPLKPCVLCPGTEVKCGKLALTAPGSLKGGRPYTLYGSFGDIPPLPPFLAVRIAAKTAPRPLPSRPGRVQSWGRQGPRIGLNELAAEAVAAMGGRHHDSQLNFASRARRCGFGLDEVLSFVAARPDMFGTGRDTEATLISVYR
ncbi:MAG: bifunctional DNA primase/polymerase [Planctomycetota bacterium]|jgi:hypothetical protein|nr:bifunctional DNA primase/polymerase [Planctomycetota bacterium]